MMTLHLKKEADIMGSRAVQRRFQTGQGAAAAR